MGRLLLLAALALPAPALAGPLTLEEVGAMAPGQRSFTGSPLLELVGLPQGIASIDPTEPGARGGAEYEVMDVGDVSLVAGPWAYGSLSGDHIYASLNAFLGAHDDEYDFVSIFVTEHLDFGAFYSPLQNDAEGIGSGIFDQTSEAGYGELEGFLFMNSIFDYTGSVHDALYFGQEIGHRWGSYVRRSGGGRDMLGRDDSHWSFFLESQNSTMEGNAWIEVEDGLFETDHLADIGYSHLDQYLMGFRDPADVPDWFLIDDPQIVRNPISWDTEPDSPPYYVVRQYYPEEALDLPSIRVRGDRVDIAIDDIVAVHGERDPDFEEAQRDFNMAFVIMMPASATLDFDQYLVVEDTREDLVALWESMVLGEATLRTQVGWSDGGYTFGPDSFPDAPAFEPDFDEGSDTGLAGSGCRSSQAGGGSPALWALLLALGLGLSGRSSRAGVAGPTSPRGLRTRQR